MSDQLTVVIADDHAWVRGQMRAALEAADCAVLGEAATADDAVRRTLELAPDVVLLDIDMPGSGIRAAEQIARADSASVVVMLTASENDDDLFGSLRAGAAGYLLKETPPDELGDTLRGVLAGRAPLSPRLVARVLDEFRVPARRRFGRNSPAASKLSPREWEVMQLLAEGLTTSEVAARLFLSATTVRVHLSTSLHKLRVGDRADAIRLLREGDCGPNG